MKYLLTSLLLIFSQFYLFPAKSDELTIASEDWCPYICTQSESPKVLDEKPGLLVDIFKAVFEPKNHRVIHTAPTWSRAIAEVRVGRNTAILGAFKSEVPDFIFPKSPTGFSQMCFYVKSENSWSFDGIVSLSKMNIAVVKDYHYDQGEFDAYVKGADNNARVQAIAGESPLDLIFKMALANRVDVFIDDVHVVDYHMNKNGLKNVFRRAGCFKGLDLYIAFSPAISKSEEYAHMLSDGIDDLRKSGKLKMILDQYGLRDWKK